MSLIRAPQQRFQPQGTGALNDAHPLRRYVKFAFLGSAGKHRDLTTHTLTSGASASIVTSAAGVGLKSDAANSHVYKQLSSGEISDFTGDLTLIWHGVILGDHTISNDRLLDISFNNTDGSPFVVAGLYRPTADQAALVYASNNGSFINASQNASLNSFYGRPLTIIAANAAGSSAVRLVVRPIGEAPLNASLTMTGSSGNPRSSSATSSITIGSIPGGNNAPNATTTAALILNRAVSEPEAVWISQNIWSFFSGPSRDIATSLMYAAAGGGGATGTLSATLGALTSAATGTVQVRGASTQTLGALTSASSGTVAVVGSSSNTLGALTSTSAGTVAVVGTASNTLGALTLSSAGTTATGPVGTLSATLGSLTSSAAGTVQVRGTSTQTLGALTSASAGSVQVAGSLSATLGALTLAGGNINAATGGLSATLDGLTVVAVGTAPLVWTVQTPANASWAAQSSSGSWVVQSVTASSWTMVA